MSKDVWNAIESLRAHSLGRLLYRAARKYNEAAVATVRSLGHPDLTLAHVMVLPHVDRDGSRLNELAERGGITKQSASELVTALESIGYLARKPDPADARATRISLTKKGERFLQAALQTKLQLERDLIRRLGPDRAHQLATLLADYSAD